ncbi:MAG TPA: helix-turn-helix domain-containing protein [Pseudonocardiaceae bacterium]|nr:helix-turn-helix domain-containing protein [Pseudonocardiaceae bacterium]
MKDQPENGAIALSPADLDAIRTTAELAGELRGLRRRHARQRGDSPLTYRELAGRTGWAHGVIGDYFTGKTLPPTDRFDVLVSLLGATPTEIVAFANARDRVEEFRRERLLANSAARRDTSTKITRRKRPDPVSGFTGRVAQLAELDHTDSPLIVVSGPAGVGKTALVTHWARQSVADWRYVNLNDDDPVQSAGLVVLDDARDADQVRPLLPMFMSNRVVVTSRDPLTGLAGGVHRIELKPLPLDDSVALLVALTGDRAEQRTAMRSLAVSCRGVPLALRIAAEYVMAHPETPLAVLAEEWSTLAFGPSESDG